MVESTYAKASVDESVELIESVKSVESEYDLQLFQISIFLILQQAFIF